MALPERIRIAEDGEATRILGAWIGNEVNDATPWEPIKDVIKAKLNNWDKTHPTLNGKKLIIQTVIGGHTQFLTKAQGMPASVESALTKEISKFIWGQDAKSRIASATLQRPIEEGGLNLLDIESRNEAIELMWLKAYLNFTPSRQPWATITDHIIQTAAPPHSVKEARGNPFLQVWNVPTRGPRLNKLNDDVKRMLKIAKKYNVNLSAIRLNPHVLAQLPAWYHPTAEQRPMNNNATKCLLKKHNVSLVVDLVRISARSRHPLQHPTHRPEQNCPCQECTNDRNQGCENPHRCVTEAHTRLDMIPPKYNPTRQDPPDGLSLTRTRKMRNEIAKMDNKEITFDPTMTCKEDLAECFRVFTEPTRLTDAPARRYRAQGPIPRSREITVYTDGACLKNGKKDARCGSGIWFGPGDQRNQAIRVPGDAQSNQVGEIAAVIAALNVADPRQPLKIITDSKYVIEGLTTHRETWENDGWIAIKNAPLFKKAIHLMRNRAARTALQWVKGHSGTIGNEESDRLAKQGANKLQVDILDLDIPVEFDLQGAKLATLTQAKAYRGILERKNINPRRSTTRNLQLTREAIKRATNEMETDATIWMNIRKAVIRPKVQQFLYRTMHNTHMVGEYWTNINNYEDRGTCITCNTPESMTHILTQCDAPPRRIIWSLAENIWPHPNIRWPDIELGTILGCGCINIQPKTNAENSGDNQDNRRITYRGESRLLQILLSESAYQIWVLRCERAIQGKRHEEEEIKRWWLRAINVRLTDDKITATRVKREEGFTNLVVNTWEQALNKERGLPINWIHDSEVLVGRTAQRAGNNRQRVF